MATINSTGLMKTPVPPYNSAKGRRFALTLAGAFAVFSLIAHLRRRNLMFDVLATVAAVFITAALVLPSRLEPVERAWMAFAHALSKVTTPIFMGIVYFVVLTPMAIVRRMAGGNPIVHKSVADSFWVTRTKSDPEAARKRMERQF